MKKLLVIAAVLVLAGSARVRAQENARVYTNPAVPSREALDRLHLKLAWRSYLPVGDRRDGIFNLQIIDDMVVVQTRSGVVTALNRDDGTVLWQRRIGLPFRVFQPIGFNSKQLFVARASMLYAVSRKSGGTAWELDLLSTVAAQPVADEERIYVSVGIGRLKIYELPKKKNTDDEIKPLAPKEAADDWEPAYRSGMRASIGMKAVKFYDVSKELPGPTHMWDYRAESRLEQPPIITDNMLVLAASSGKFFMTTKHQRHVPFTFEAAAGLSAPMGHYSFTNEDKQIEDIVYIAARDNNMYALDVERTRLLWRFTGDAPLLSKPEVTDKDIFLVASTAGMYRINRQNGDPIWHHRAAERFLSMNPKFVYATNAAGRLLILDYARGKELASYDTTGYTVPISNEASDRFFLASHNGLLLCLHDRDYVKPLVTKTVPVRKPPKLKPWEMPEGDKKPDDKKVGDKKKDDKKMDDKKKDEKKDDKKKDDKKDDKKEDKKDA